MPEQQAKKPDQRRRPRRGPKSAQSTIGGTRSENDDALPSSSQNLPSVQVPDDPSLTNNNSQLAPQPRQDTNPQHDKRRKSQRVQNHSVKLPSDTPTRSPNQDRGNKPNNTRTTSHPAILARNSTQPKPSEGTPVKPAGTPARAYAGPKFHNSPAASSLPLPSKYLSKSVPNVDKTTTLSSLLEKEGVDSTSENENPLAKGDGTPDLFRTSREESPLDIFFQADRAAKVKLLQKNQDSASGGNEDPFNPPKGMASRPSLGPTQNRHHTRQLTDGNAGSVFPLEMDNEPRQKRSLPQEAKTGSYTSDINLPAMNLEEDDLQAKTRALKKLLNFQDPLGSTTNALELPATGLSSPSPDPLSRARSSARLAGTPPTFPNGMDGSTPEQRQQALIALAEKQIATPSAGYNQRPQSSSLRKELKLPASPTTTQTPQAPSTPTPSQRQEKRRPSTRKNPASAHHAIPTPPSMHSGNTGYTAESTKNGGPGMRNIEDDLRRMLKLDALPSEGVTRV